MHDRPGRLNEITHIENVETRDRTPEPRLGHAFAVRFG